MDIYSPKLPGYFYAFINGKRYNKLIYGVDPIGIAEVSPEEVALISYGITDRGIWTSFHLADEYARGLAGSSQDHRAFDITHHEIDGQIKGAQITTTDRVTFVALSSPLAIPLRLFPSRRVKSVKRRGGKEID